MEMKLESEVIDKIHTALNETPLDEIEGMTYWDAYELIKSLNLGHQPTKAETDEVAFYAAYLVMQARRKMALISYNKF